MDSLSPLIRNIQPTTYLLLVNSLGPRPQTLRGPVPSESVVQAALEHPANEVPIEGLGAALRAMGVVPRPSSAPGSCEDFSANLGWYTVRLAPVGEDAVAVAGSSTIVVLDRAAGVPILAFANPGGF